MAHGSADESADGACIRGEGFLRDMADQSARAHTFDRRMRWFWLRRSLRDTSPAPEDVGDVGDAEGSVDLRVQPVVLTGEPAAAAPGAPAPQAAPSARSAESPRLPRQRD